MESEAIPASTLGSWAHVFLLRTQNHVKCSDSKHILCPRKIVPQRILPLSFSCVYTRPFHSSFRLTASRWWSVWCDQCIQCSWTHSHASFAVKCVPWSDAMLCKIPCLWIRHSGASWILEGRKRKYILIIGVYFYVKESLALPGWKKSNKVNLLPSDQLVSLKTSAILRAQLWSLSVAGKTFRGSSGSLGCRYPCVTFISAALTASLLNVLANPGVAAEQAWPTSTSQFILSKMFSVSFIVDTFWRVLICTIKIFTLCVHFCLSIHICFLARLRVQNIGFSRKQTLRWS